MGEYDNQVEYIEWPTKVHKFTKIIRRNSVNRIAGIDSVEEIAEGFHSVWTWSE